MFLRTFSLHPIYNLLSFLRAQEQYLQLALVVVAVLVGGLIVGPSPVLTPSVQVPTFEVAAPAVAVAETPAAPQTPQAKTAPAVAPVQKCTPPAFGLPSKVNLATAAAGELTQIIDAPVYYRVYGNTAAQINSQLRDCAAVPATAGGTSYAAATSGVVTWQYNTTTDGSGFCTLANVKVGLHTRMVLPEWKPTDAAASGLAAQWQRVISGTTTHESEHVTIYQQHAKQLLSDLATMPATSCASIEASIQAKTAAAIAALGVAQAGLDTRTGHGATQGAVLH